jgi:hypothetical protein
MFIFQVTRCLTASQHAAGFRVKPEGSLTCEVRLVQPTVAADSRIRAGQRQSPKLSVSVGANFDGFVNLRPLRLLASAGCALAAALTGRLSSPKEPASIPVRQQASTDTRTVAGPRPPAGKQIDADGTPTDQENNVDQLGIGRDQERSPRAKTDDPADTIFRFAAETRLRRLNNRLRRTWPQWHCDVRSTNQLVTN